MLLYWAKKLAQTCIILHCDKMFLLESVLWYLSSVSCLMYAVYMLCTMQQKCNFVLQYTPDIAFMWNIEMKYKSHIPQEEGAVISVVQN